MKQILYNQKRHQYIIFFIKKENRTKNIQFINSLLMPRNLLLFLVYFL